MTACKSSLVPGDLLYRHCNVGVGWKCPCYQQVRYLRPSAQPGYILVDIWNAWWRRWEETQVHIRRVRVSPPRGFEAITHGAYIHTFMRRSQWPAYLQEQQEER